MTDEIRTPKGGDAPKVAVIGLGAMGLPIAERLSPVFPVLGFDLEAERRDLADRRGIRTVDAAEVAVSDADIVLLMVRTPAQLHSVLDSDTGVGARLRPGAVVVVCSTIGIEAVRTADETLRARDVFLVDAPVSGGPRRAAEGDLLVVVGAEDRALELALPVLERLASTLRIVGGSSGAGQAFKTVNQLLCGVHIAAAAEALALARRLGLDPELTLDTLQEGAAASFMLGDRGVRALQAYESDGAPVASRLDIFVKDLGIVADAAAGLGLATPVAAAAHQLFLSGLAQGLGDSDDSSVITVLDPC